MSDLQRRLRRLALASALASACATAPHAQALPPPVPGCSPLPPQALSRLTLFDSVGQALCRSPLLGQALQLALEQQAGVDLARSAYRPRYALSAEVATNRIPTSDSGAGSVRSSFTGSLGVSWVLYDAGIRDANLFQFRMQLTAAQAAQQSAALAALNETLRLFVEAATAKARLQALRDTEAIAKQSQQAAGAKYEAMVASLSDKLQAQTALAQATLERVRADGAWESARGLLAQSMGLPLGQKLDLAPAAEAFPAGAATVIDEGAIGEAAREHPRVRSAQAEIQVAKARLDAVRAEYAGNISLSAGASRTRDLNAAASPFVQRLSGSLFATLPIFSGAEQQAREAQVLAQVAGREEALTQVEREVEAEIWRNARLLETEAQNLEAARLLAAIAAQSYEITFGRYRAGVGSILELLSTQAALSNARSQLTQAELGHAQARLRLQVASGTMMLAPQ
jgi:outer membrane protein